MKEKLTLKINSDVLSKAKVYAKETNTSLSSIIENYLISLTLDANQERKVNYLVQDLTGIISLNENSDNRNYR